MSPAILDIDVTLAPDASQKDGIAFRFSSTSPCLDDETGNITLPENGRKVKIHFHLLTETITWTKPPYKGTFKVSFLTGKNALAEDTLWIWPEGWTSPDGSRKKGKVVSDPYSRYDFCGDPGAAKHQHVCVHNANDKREQHNYGLAVGIQVAEGKIEVVRNDPRIRNGGISAN